MDTKSNQKTRRFTKLAWCEERGKDPYKKARSRSQEARKARPTGAASTDIEKTRQVNIWLGAWLLYGAMVAAILILGGLNAS